MRVLSNLAVKKLCFCSLLFPSAGRKWNIAGTNVRSEPLSFVKSAGGAPGTRALVPGALIIKKIIRSGFYSALKINADYTITRNRKDFYLYDSLFRCVGTGRMILVKNSLCQ
mgnify:CR=1 FL=1